MEISARNKMNGKITDIKTGGVMASVKIQVEEPGEITALITKESVEKLGLKEGDDATAIIKSTEIIVGKEKLPTNLFFLIKIHHLPPTL